VNPNPYKKYPKFVQVSRELPKAFTTPNDLQKGAYSESCVGGSQSASVLLQMSAQFIGPVPDNTSRHCMSSEAPNAMDSEVRARGWLDKLGPRTRLTVSCPDDAACPLDAIGP
jgi:hypothetical protein